MRQGWRGPMIRGSVLLRTRCQLADCVEELELPALFDVVDGIGDLVRRRLYVELEPEAIDIPLSCSIRRYY